MAKIGISPPPLGSIILVSNQEHPAVTYPNTGWEPVVNSVFFITKGKQKRNPDGSWKYPFVRPTSWRRIK